MKNQRRAKKPSTERFASACLRLADLVETRQRSLKRFRRRCVFSAKGYAGCPLGHALEMSNHRPHDGFVQDGPRSVGAIPRYLTNEESFKAIFKKDPSDGLANALESLEVCNLSKNGDARREAIVRGLRDIAQELTV